ncbi:MAG: (Fe-S)-binding protein [Pseudomonadota bacterium]
MQTHSIDKNMIIQASDNCVMCGLCLPHCPTYNAAQIESESPRGRIALVRALYEEKLPADETVQNHLNHCLGCMNCQYACPANVDYEKIIDAGRAKTAIHASWRSKLKKSFVLLILSHTKIRKLFKYLISVIKSLGLIKLVSMSRLVQLLPSKSLTFETPNSSNTGPKIVIFQSCANELINDPTISATTSLLARLGCEIVSQNEVHCCGALHQHSGKLGTAKKLKHKFIHKSNSIKVDFIASIATGCGAQIKHYENEINSKIIDINELLLTQLQQSDLSFQPLAKKVFIHKPCTLKQIAIQDDVTEQLLNYIPEIELLQFDDQAGCCGAGGLNSVTHPNLANDLIDNKVNELNASKDTILASSNIGCAIHFQARLKQENIPVQVVHPVTLLAQQML